MSSVRWAFNFNCWKPTQSELLLATSCIQPEEKQRIARFVFKKDFKASLIGRLMIRKFLSDTTNIPYDKIRIVRDEKGKPMFVHGSKECNFNVSHQGDFTVLSGETGDTKIGVDVMQIGYSGGKTLREFFRIMNRQFSADEWSVIKSDSNENNQLKLFCRNWSLKESYVKAIGVGITVNLMDISFKIKTKNLTLDSVVTDTELYVSGSKVPWVFEETLLDSKHCVSSALYSTSGSAGHKPVTFVFLSFDELMKGSISLLDKDLEYCNNFFLKDE